MLDNPVCCHFGLGQRMHFDRLKRREFLTLLGGAAAAQPLAAQAQQPPVPVVGFLNSLSPDESTITAVRRGLNQTGYVEGKNVVIELRWAEGQYDRLPSFVADLIRHQVALILAIGGPSARAAKAATSTIPIVFQIGFDPVAGGLAASLARPGGNATGTTVIGHELNVKKVELLCELVPTATIIGVLSNPSNPTYESYLQDIKTAADGRGRRTLNLNVTSERDLDSAFASLRQQGADGLVITDEPLFIGLRVQLVSLAARYKIPTIYPWREYAQAGGLISYGTNRTDGLRQVGIYAGRILKGDKPSDLPVLQPTKFETVLNLKTAKALGLDVPTVTLLRADEVIE
jgi:putative ABC transport system substrate-binding protein